MSPSLCSRHDWEKANLKQPTVNDAYSKLRGRERTVILTSTHQWNLWLRGGQLLKMSVPLSIFIHSHPSLSSSMFCHPFISFAHHLCFILSCHNTHTSSCWWTLLFEPMLGFFPVFAYSISLNCWQTEGVSKTVLKQTHVHQRRISFSLNSDSCQQHLSILLIARQYHHVATNIKADLLKWLFCGKGINITNILPVW